MQNESRLERSIANFVKEKGWLYIKQPANIYKGIPDRLIITNNGYMFFVELKDEKGKLSKIQERWRKKLQKCKVNVFEVKSIDEFKEIYEKFKGE